MDKFGTPTKEQVRHWLKEQVKSHRPPDRADIRRALGWDLAAAQARERNKK